MHRGPLRLPVGAVSELHIFLHRVLPASHLADLRQGSGTTSPPALLPPPSTLPVPPPPLPSPPFLPHPTPPPFLPQSTNTQGWKPTTKCLHQVGVVLANGFFFGFPVLSKFSTTSTPYFGNKNIKAFFQKTSEKCKIQSSIPPPHSLLPHPSHLFPREDSSQISEISHPCPTRPIGCFTSPVRAFYHKPILTGGLYANS